MKSVKHVGFEMKDAVVVMICRHSFATNAREGFCKLTSEQRL